MKSWNSATEDITLKDGTVVKEYDIRFRTTDRKIYKRIERFFQDIMDEADTLQTEDDYFLELMDAVKRGEMSDASANQAYYEYINKQAEESDTPQTDCDTCRHDSEPWDSETCDGCSKAHSNYEPQTDCGWGEAK